MHSNGFAKGIVLPAKAVIWGTRISHNTHIGTLLWALLSWDACLFGLPEMLISAQTNQVLLWHGKYNYRSSWGNDVSVLQWLP